MINNKNPAITTDIIDELDDSIFIQRNKELFVRCAKLYKGIRRSGEPYFIHPVTVAYILALTLPDSYPNKERCISIAFAHDLLEEAHMIPTEFLKN